MTAELSHPSFREALRFWSYLGFVSFGGPAGQIAILHRECVERRKWIGERDFTDALNFCMLLPGPEAQQLATYIGWLMHRTRGGIAAGALFVLPSLAILIALSWIYVAFGEVPAIAGAFYGIKPAVTSIVVFAAYRLGSRALTNAWTWSVAVLALVAVAVAHLPFPLVIVLAAAIGFAGGRIDPAKFSLRGGHGAGKASYGPAVIDDGMPTPPHAVFSRGRFARVLLVSLALWGGAIATLTIAVGSDAVLTRMAWFFTQAALLTFGGAYAVLPYVFQGAVEQYHWLTAGQMIDGLALGESTPGPLIMVVAFVGFVGGWTHAVPGSDSLFVSGAVAAAVVTYFTFLPSFCFVLLGGPLIESTHGDLRFTAPLTGITAAVVGVIVNLALFFAWHVLWPSGSGGRFDAVAGAIGVLAAVLLFRFKVGVMPVLGIAALLGLGWRLLA